MSEQNPNIVRVERVLQKLEQVRAAKLSYFGSEKHQFRLNPPLSEADLQAFEARYQIQLPADYRTFLQHAGNGGAGPYYGIFPLDEWDDFAGWVLDDDVPDDFLALPCPLYPKLRSKEDWANGLGDVSPYQGTLSLGSQGGDSAIQLIVSGPFAGRVVYVDYDDRAAPYMLYEPDFLTWYERWLDELLQGYKIDWFGYGPGGGEDEFFCILDDPATDSEFKSEAAQAFYRLPRLSEKAARRIPEYLGHTIPGVRSGALAAMRRFQVANTAEAAARLLDDPSPKIRVQAVRAVIRLDPEQWAGAALRLLFEDPDKDVVLAAFSELRDAGVLSKSQLLRIIEQPSLGRIRNLAGYKVKWANEDLPLLMHLLSDSDIEVRSHAIRGLGQIKARNSLPEILELLSREENVLINLWC